MENKDEWEPAGFTLLHKTDNVVGGRVIIEDPGYEYRLQRRKKEKVMPELRIGMGVSYEFDYSLGAGVVTGVNEDCITATGLSGCDFVFPRWKIREIYVAGSVIWRRE